jgi:formylglycine-generating enzyme required for sulfatase activity
MSVILMFIAVFGAMADSSEVSSPASDYSALAIVPGGTYTQTDETGINSFRTTVSAFRMGKYEVTYELWNTVYQWAVANGYVFQNAGVESPGRKAGAAPTDAKYEPVEAVNWRDAIVWCNAYSRKSGLKPVYYLDPGFAALIRDSTSGAYAGRTCTAAGCYDDPYVNWNANGYRLPTEAEYQYAASYKDGSNWTPYNYASGAASGYADEPATGLVAWYHANSGRVPHDVGGKKANALGIYDMSGNMWEWCWDWYGPYPSAATVNYRGPANGSSRVMRGGCFSNYAGGMQVGERGVNLPFFLFGSVGFRVARIK